MLAEDLPAFGPWRLRLAAWSGVGIIVEGLTHADALAPPGDYVDEVLVAPEHRDRFFDLVDRVGLVACKHSANTKDPDAYQDVRGRSSRGRLSQGEYYHHDGCSGPSKPRILEIRCPHQDVERHTRTAVAPFPETLHAMLLELPAALRQQADVAGSYAAATAGETLPVDQWDKIQGAVLRTVRRALSAEDARAYLRAVDLRAGAHREPWTMGESRFIANANPVRTMQHRRAYLEPPGSRPCGQLIKRWPDGPWEVDSCRDDYSLQQCVSDPMGPR